jgi:hypothetical protein
VGRRALIFVALLVAAPAVHPCGVCLEDRIAAVYDHALVIRTLEANQVVVFFAIEGAIPHGAGALRKIAAIAAFAPAVRKDSVRLSRDAASLALAFDPRRATLAKVQETLERKLAPTGLSLVALRVMERPGELAQSFWTLGKAKPSVATHTTTFATKTAFCTRVMSANFLPRETSTGLANLVSILSSG